MKSASSGSMTDKVQQLSQALEHILKVADLLDSSINNHPNSKDVEFLFHPNPGLFLRLFGRNLPTGAVDQASGQSGQSPYFDPVNEIRAGSSIASSCLQDVTVAWLSNQNKMTELQNKCREQACEVKLLQTKIDDRERLGAIRSSDMFQKLLASGGGGDSSADPPCDCCTKNPELRTTTSSRGAKCPHKEALADHVIDRTFDDHKQLLRDRLAKAEAELEGFRSGDIYKTLNAKLKESYEAREALQKEVDALRRQIMDAKFAQMEQRVKDRENGVPPSSLVRSGGPDPLREAKEQLAEVQMRSAMEMQIHVQSLISYQGALSSVMAVGYDLKLGLVLEGLSGLLHFPKAVRVAPALRPTPPSSPTDQQSRHIQPVASNTNLRSRPTNTSTIRKPVEEPESSAPGSGLGLSSGTCGADLRWTVEAENSRGAFVPQHSQVTGQHSLSGKRLNQQQTNPVPAPVPVVPKNQQPTDPSSVSKAPMNSRTTRANRAM